MPTLSKELRRILENVVADARRFAEAGAEQALKQLAVHHSECWAGMTTDEKSLREKLRAHGRQLGDKRDANRTQEIVRLKQAGAYEHWHRMLFARFLAENNLLIHPEYGEPISLEEVRELAREQNTDWLSIAASFAQEMLIEVFRPDDPVLQLGLPPETRQKLEEKLASLPAEVFTAEDSLGWVYQFWQRDEKDSVNLSEVKIGASALAPVTQLFTEDYMVLFLLHNTLGAWWTAKRRAEGKDPALRGYEWTFLRLNEDGMPATGSYPGWPTTVSDLRLLDPCMGSGHFLAVALPILAQMRAEEEGLSISQAVVAVLSDNLFGLELDARCSQIAAFNLALTSWRLIGKHCDLPPMNLACSGLGINVPEADWVRLAGQDGKAREEMLRLYSLFRDAPVLGSLIDPRRLQANVYAAGAEAVLSLIEEALRKEEQSVETKELAIAAQGLVAAFRILSSQFTIVATNVPYLGRGKQDAVLAQYCGEFHSDAKVDLATCFVDRCLRFCMKGGSAALVTPQNWLFLGSYKKLRERLLKTDQWDFLARIGEHGFDSSAAAGAFVVLLGFTRRPPSAEHMFAGWDASGADKPEGKSGVLRSGQFELIPQSLQLTNPDARVSLGSSSGTVRLSQYASSFLGLGTGDYPHYGRVFWEFPAARPGWVFQQASVEATVPWGGREHMLSWDDSKQRVRGISDAEKDQIHNQDQSGQQAWGKKGICVGLARQLRCTLYTGEKFDKALAVLIPAQEEHIPALWSFCATPEFDRLVRQLDQKVIAANGTLVKIPFDLSHWINVAANQYPNGLPGPKSEDPTQWLFNGHPKNSHHPLQVAVARLVGYRWPRQTGSIFPDTPAVETDGLEAHADTHGIVCLSSLAGESPAADRLRALLADAFGADWSASKLAELLDSGYSLETWLRDRFFAEHCELFHSRPFVWHVWDGRNDGFHALVNYHKLAGPNGEGRKTLERLIYTALGDWITRQKAEVAAGNDGADARLAAAQHLQSELEQILTGEDPYDIFVRWKPIHEQAIGWDPDLNDGIRLNIRPWLTTAFPPHTKPKKGACVLRSIPIQLPLGKDKGKGPARDKTEYPWTAGSTDRNNDIHLSIDEKRAAREKRKK